ncbi:hypothetical protein ABL78_2214 [Leptomonas seymouri]|uniref:Uncharacterized protein n=1 Tax=Leptomonas seymouri TaxID=5684 RepID=A0A0N0P7D4_LEPSE|nr:hypothetical protein ABL78_2214 [Leptomonas seymouri]|eukprot:KPI88676.1 hypothetical protein ABL78_2214 [Leptomonas seymouri]
MTALQRAAYSGHPTPGAVLTAAQRALQQECSSLPSVSTTGVAAAAAALNVEGESSDSFVASPPQGESPDAVVASQQQQQPLASAVRLARTSLTDGMRREWNFALQFVHVAGQLLVPCSPQWEYDFIDIDRTAFGLAQRTAAQSSTGAVLMLAALSYADRTAVVQAAPPASAVTSPSTAALHQHSGNSTRTSGGAAAAASVPYDHLLSSPSLAGGSGDVAAAAAGGGGDWWVERSKQVELLYCHPAPGMTIQQFCKHCVKFILRDPHVISVDGDCRLAHLRVGDKLRCPYQLGGRYRSFHMRYILRDRSELQESYVYAIGALVGQRGYLLRAQCTSAEELEGYVHSILLPTYTTVGRAQFGVDVTYHNTSPTTLLADQQEAFGELQYVDHKAAIVLVTPVYPMKIIPDYSPAKTVGVGSIACVTLELNVYERLVDDAVAAEIIGVAKYKVNPVVLCVEVEEVSRMDYPKVMSTEQYSELKAKRVADVFPDARMVGLSTSLYMGNRTGRSRTMTFTYEPLRCVVKALVTSTLVGNFGVTAFYITKLSGGLFDSHLYAFQQLLSGMEFLPQNSFAKKMRVSRYQVQNIRLGEEDLIRAYRCVSGAGSDRAASKGEGGCEPNASATITAETRGGSLRCSSLPPHLAFFTTSDPALVNASRERHLHMLALGDDGRVEGGVEAVVPVEEGGLDVYRAMQNTVGRQGKRADTGRQRAMPSDAAGATRSASGSLLPNSPPTSKVVSMAAGGYVAAAAGMDDSRSGVPGRSSGFEEGEETEDNAAAMLVNAETSSAHSGSRITVESISDLMGSLPDSRDETTSIEEEEEEYEEGGAGYAEHDQESPTLHQDEPEGWDSAADAAAAVGASSSLPSLRRGSQRSPMTSAASRRAEESSKGSSGTASHPTSVRRRRHGGQQASADTPFNASSASVPAAPATPAAPGAEERIAEHDDAAAVVTDATMSGGAAAGTAASAPGVSEEALKQQELYEQLVGKDDSLVQKTLREGEGGKLYGPSLRDVYARCCEIQRCRPNSYLMKKLPTQPELTYSVEELDLSSNYVGHNGFVAVLHLLEHLPRLRVVYFNNMSLDNTDVENLCYVLATNTSVREVHLENNIGISLPSTRHFTALLRVNQQIEVMSLDGTRLSPTLVKSLKAEASRARV